MTDYRILKNGVIYLELDGRNSHYEMGYAHGACLKDKIAACVSYVKNWYCEELGDAIGQKFIHKLQYETGYLEDAKRYLPLIYEELCGIAAGCGLSVEDVFLLNCLDEGFYLLLEEKAGRVPSGKCTCIGLRRSETQPVRMAQNLDFSTAYNGFQTLFRLQEVDRQILIFSFCGQLMGMGVNNKGISVIANAIVNGTVSLEHGVPNTLMQRAFYECNSIEECEALMRRCPRSTSTAYTISDFQRVCCFEATVHSVVEVPMESSANGIAHTNHLLASTDTRNFAGACEGRKILKTAENVSWEMTEERLAIAEELVRANGAVVSAEALMDFLKTPPILRNYGDPTIQSFVAVLDPDNPYIWIAAGDEERCFVKVEMLH